MTQQQNFFTIPQSGTVSEAVGIRNAREIGVSAPALTSGQCFVQVAHDTTSANFGRAFDEQATPGEYVWPIEDGGNAVNLSRIVSPFAYMRLELDVAQTDVRTFVVHGKM